MLPIARSCIWSPHASKKRSISSLGAAVIASVTEAVKQAEQAQYEAEAPIRAKLKELARCPAGFDWHRDGDGWRCNGGSHFVSNDDLPTING